MSRTRRPFSGPVASRGSLLPAAKSISPMLFGPNACSRMTPAWFADYNDRKNGEKPRGGRRTGLDFELAEEHRMIKDLVARFVRDELLPLEAKTLAREAEGRGLGLDAEDHKRLDARSRELGLWGLDAPEDIGG